MFKFGLKASMRGKIYKRLCGGRAAIFFGVCSALALLNTAPLKSAPVSESSSLGGAKITKTSNFPKIISPDDERIYRRIFALQKKGKWRKADKLIKTLTTLYC